MQHARQTKEMIMSICLNYTQPLVAEYIPIQVAAVPVQLPLPACTWHVLLGLPIRSKPSSHATSQVSVLSGIPSPPNEHATFPSAGWGSTGHLFIDDWTIKTNYMCVIMDKINVHDEICIRGFQQASNFWIKVGVS